MRMPLDDLGWRRVFKNTLNPQTVSAVERLREAARPGVVCASSGITCRARTASLYAVTARNARRVKPREVSLFSLASHNILSYTVIESILAQSVRGATTRKPFLDGVEL